MFKICTDDIFEISDLDREIHNEFKSRRHELDRLKILSSQYHLEQLDIMKSVIKVEKQLTVLCVFWCATIIGVIATICYTLPYLWPELYE